MFLINSTIRFFYDFLLPVNQLIVKWIGLQQDRGFSKTVILL